MEIEAITVELVERTLRAWQQNKTTPAEWSKLDYLESMRGTVEERLEYFRDYVTDYIVGRLAYYRQRVGIATPVEVPASLEMLIRVVQADFEPENSHLEAWSALYFRFIEDDFSPEIKYLTQEMNVNEKLFRRRVEFALHELTHTIRRWEMKTHEAFHGAEIRASMQEPNKQLYGSTLLLDDLCRSLLDQNGPRCISIEGIGGIGKTALARGLVERLANHIAFRDIVWISARHEWFNEHGELEIGTDSVRSLEDIITRLVRKLGYDQLDELSVEAKLEKLIPILAITPYLIVIDNLETVKDSQLLVPKLHSLSGKTRFVFTSRYSLRHYDYVHIVPVPELSATDSRTLIESELFRLEHRRRLLSEDAAEIYSVVGGVPLALKLTAAQLIRLPVREVLQGLRDARREAPETMFRYIYRRTWHLLSGPTQKLLMAMCDISPEGANIGWIRSIAMSSGLSEDEFDTGLAELHDFSLLEVNFSFREPRYRLHRLTITFLQMDVINLVWTNEATDH